jgi:hypothetical protein
LPVALTACLPPTIAPSFGSYLPAATAAVVVAVAAAVVIAPSVAAAAVPAVTAVIAVGLDLGGLDGLLNREGKSAANG